MTPAAALLEARRIAATGIFLLTDHAQDRMVERRVTRRDIQAAIGSAAGALWQASEQTWRIEGGVDRRGDGLTVVVVLIRGMMIVTIY